MAKTYTPNPNRRVVNGRADVSAEELADFKRKYGADKTLRDLLNMDKGLSRRGGQSMREKFANQYEDPIKAFASAELGMGEGPGAMRKKPMPAKRAPMTPMRGTAFSEEPVSLTPSSRSEAPKARSDANERLRKIVKDMEAEEGGEGLRRGGKVKSYAKGGSVKGAGAAQRGVRPCKYV